jgi:hypothetical protein
MVSRRRADVKSALVAGASSYLPVTALLALVVAPSDMARASRLLGVTDSPFVLAVPVALLLTYMLVVDAALPIGESKVAMARRTSIAAYDRMLANDAWYLRVVIVAGAALTLQLVCDLATGH